MVISGSDGVTFPDSTNQFSGGAFSFKNRIINGDMRIDQRNAGASVTPAASAYTLDRWRIGVGVAAGSMSFQQSTDAPSGFTNSMVCTVVTSATPASGDLLYLQQNIEGYNVSDFGFGTASAKTITISFWVKSSVTGNKSFSLINGTLDRSYCTTYTINSANTWEYKSITIAGDTTGTWATASTTGLEAHWNFSVGSTFEATANDQWESGRKYSTASTPDFISNSGATFYITGVQLEVGSVATPFERRPYGTELALCQRYFEILTGEGETSTVAMGINTTSACGVWRFSTTKRAAPTMSSSATASNFVVYTGGGSINCSVVPTYSLNAAKVTTNSSPIRFTTAGSVAANSSYLLMILGTSSDFIAASAEL
jgi:hypothetical protein